MESLQEIIMTYLPFLLVGIGVSILLLFLLCFILFQRLRRQKKRYNLFMGTARRPDKNLETKLTEYFDSVQEIKDKYSKLLDMVTDIDATMAQNIQKVGFVRYNPFEEMGGNLCFAVALLDREDNGIVLNGIHSRTGSFTYAKPIEKGVSTYILSVEEQRAIELAKENAHKPKFEKVVKAKKKPLFRRKPQEVPLEEEQQQEMQQASGQQIAVQQDGGESYEYVPVPITRVNPYQLKQARQRSSVGDVTSAEREQIYEEETKAQRIVNAGSIEEREKIKKENSKMTIPSKDTTPIIKVNVSKEMEKGASEIVGINREVEQKPLPPKMIHITDIPKKKKGKKKSKEEKTEITPAIPMKAYWAIDVTEEEQEQEVSFEEGIVAIHRGEPKGEGEETSSLAESDILEKMEEEKGEQPRPKGTFADLDESLNIDFDVKAIEDDDYEFANYEDLEEEVESEPVVSEEVDEVSLEETQRKKEPEPYLFDEDSNEEIYDYTADFDFDLEEEERKLAELEVEPVVIAPRTRKRLQQEGSILEEETKKETEEELELEDTLLDIDELLNMDFNLELPDLEPIEELYQSFSEPMVDLEEETIEELEKRNDEISSQLLQELENFPTLGEGLPEIELQSTSEEIESEIKTELELGNTDWEIFRKQRLERIRQQKLQNPEEWD